MKKLNLMIALLLFGFISISAQSDETKEKLKNLEGDATKITIETADGEVEITGEDAEVLFKRMKAKKNIMIKKIHHGDMDESGNVMFYKKGMHSGDITIDVKVDDADGEKVVVIKKNVDGKEIVEEYKGEEAEKYLMKHSGGKHGSKFISDEGEVTIIMEMDGDDLHWISEDSDKDIMKKINVEVNDGVKKVTVTTTEDGNENVEVFEGAEADVYLEKMKHGKIMKIHVSEDGDKKIIKKKVIIIEEKDDDGDKEEDK